MAMDQGPKCLPKLTLLIQIQEHKLHSKENILKSLETL